MDNKPEQYLILTDSWKLVKKFLNISNSQEFSQFMFESNEIYKRYNSEFCKNIIMACAEEVARILLENEKLLEGQHEKENTDFRRK